MDAGSIFTARRIPAVEAEVMGLVNRMAPSGQMMEVTIGMADAISQNAPLALAQAKHAIDYGSEVDLVTGLGIETNAYDVLIPTKDRLEGLTAFKEKRKPVYRRE